LSDIITIVLYSYLSDCENSEKIYDYAIDKRECLSEFLELPCGILSHDTVNRVFRLIYPEQLENVLTQLGQHIVGLQTAKQRVVDGKQLRGTCKPLNYESDDNG
jgi:hypothetical protein